MNKLLLFGDTEGVKQLLRHVPVDAIAGICMASIRPQYFVELKSIARKLELPIFVQPRNSDPSSQDFHESLLNLKADRAVVNSYAMLLPKSLLGIFPKGALNFHSALLPRNRGPNPIQWALINGDKVTGVTLHEMSSEFDQGGIIDQTAVKISFSDNWLSLKEKLLAETDTILTRNLDLILFKDIVSTPQDEGVATKNPRRTEEDSFFKLSDPISLTYRLHKAVLPPLPPATTTDCTGNKTSLTRQLSLVSLAILIFTGRFRCLFSRLTANLEGHSRY
jgi:methionyl-tRNA formyltransferase